MIVALTRTNELLHTTLDSSLRRTPLPFRSLDSSRLAELKQVFKRQKNSPRKHMPFGFASRFHLTSPQPSIFLVRITQDQCRFTPDMKKNLILSMLISVAMMCSCQKQDSAAEQELAQRKTELDARENALNERLNALDERVNALDERVKALLEKEQTSLSARTTATDAQGQTPDPAEIKAQRDAAIQQFSAEIRARVPDDSKMKAESDRARRDALEKLQTQSQPKSKMSGGAVFPAPEATSPSPSPTPE